MTLEVGVSKQGSIPSRWNGTIAKEGSSTQLMKPSVAWNTSAFFGWMSFLRLVSSLFASHICSKASTSKPLSPRMNRLVG